MKTYFTLLLFFVFCAGLLTVDAQINKIDSTLKIGKVGYRITCTNKSPDQNELRIRPVGFENTARDLAFYIKGRVVKAEIDDLNNDNYPDLVVYIFSGSNAEFGTVYVFASEENKSISPFGLPDAMLDGKLKIGYKGYDQFTLIQGRLLREYPIYKDGDAKGKPTGGKRIVQYSVVPGGGGYQFKVQNTSDIQ